VKYTVRPDSSEPPYHYAVVGENGIVRGRAAERAGARRLAKEFSAEPRPRPAHRPRRDPKAARVIKSYRLHPDTALKIARESKRSGESQGRVVDWLISRLFPGN